MDTADRATTPLATPTPLDRRSPAPDVARGAMLLLIAVANAPFYLWTASSGTFGAHPVEGGTADRVAQTLALVLVDGRTYPLFAFLFGYGIVQLYRRQHAAGVPHREARRLLRRRHGWMVAFGAVHAALLWFGDVVGAYGLAGLVLTALFIDRRDRTIRVWIGVLTGLVALFALLVGALAVLVALAGPEAAGDDGFTIPEPAAVESYLPSVPARLGVWLVIAPAQGLLVLVTPIAVLVAFLAARHRVLEQPAEHLPLLRRTAVTGIAVGWGVGVVLALQNLGALGVDRSLDFGLLPLQLLSGLACGLGYAAAFGLLAARRGARRGPVVRALQATGRRSMTCYVAQSVVLAPLLSAWGLGLGAHLSSWSVALVAVATWGATVALAVALERAGRRGPAETLLRRLAYPRPAVVDVR
ncbi:DUF418 domain-containing protein [Kineococcus sp. SYSU DK002]|uniref:DUF418 domain-containing protein n=1 Tax=Kineococcus sp. SYSU DK002 TaxID=3383123 RepID=UPI003D7E2217